MEEPSVSIIIPTYNSSSHLKKCLESVTKQNYGNLEIITVDGGSEDSTIEIIEDFDVELYQKDLGMSSARLYGSHKSTGKYLLHIDSDMRIPVDLVAKCVDYCEEKESGLIIGERNIGSTFWAKATDVGKRINNRQQVGNLRFIQRDTYFKLGGHEEGLVAREDQVLHNRVASSGYPIGYISTEIRHYVGDLSLIELVKLRLYYAKTLKTYYEKNMHKTNPPKSSGGTPSVPPKEVLYDELTSNPEYALGYLFISIIGAVINNYYGFKFKRRVSILT